MTYQTQSALTADQAFRGRVTAATTEQAQIFAHDGRADIAALARAAIMAPEYYGAAFVPLVATQPGIGDATDQTTISDAQILSAVQTIWPTYAAAFAPQP